MRDPVQSKIAVAVDLSCLLDPPLTGVGYVALNQMRAMRAHRDQFDLRMFGARSRRGPRDAGELHDVFSRVSIISYCRTLKPELWTRANFPPIEWFCGKVDIAHDFFHQLPAASAAIRMTTIHDLSFIRHPETHTPETVAQQTRLVKHAAQHADALVVVSEFVKQEVMDLLGVDAARIYVVPNGVDLGEFEGQSDCERLRQRYDIKRDYFIYLGTLEARKNLPRFIEAYARFAKGRDVPNLLLVGKVGWLAQPVFDAIDRFGVRDRVRQLGHVPREDAIGLLKGAVACVYPSFYEGFGLPALEAMAAGTPLIVSKTASLPEVVGNEAAYIDPFNVDSIVNALTQVIDEPEIAAQRALRAHDRAREFSWARSVDALTRVYRTLANS